MDSNIVNYQGKIGEIFYKEGDEIIIDILDTGEEIKCKINDVTFVANYHIKLQIVDKINENPGVTYENLMGLPFSEKEINDAIQELHQSNEIVVLERFVLENKYPDWYFYPKGSYHLVLSHHLRLKDY